MTNLKQHTENIHGNEVLANKKLLTKISPFVENKQPEKNKEDDKKEDDNHEDIEDVDMDESRGKYLSKKSKPLP